MDIALLGMSIPVLSDNVRQVNGNLRWLRYNKHAMQKLNFFSVIFRDRRHFERPFFLFLSLVLVGLYVWALSVSAVSASSWKIALLTVLMGTHIALYWISPRVFEHPRWLAPYLFIQGLLAFAMGMLVQFSGFVFGVYPGLIGLSIGMPVKRVWRVVTVGCFMALSLVNYMFVAGSGAVLWWVLESVPVVLFVTMYVSMYLRQAEAVQQAQVLLKDLEIANRQLTEYAARVEDLTITSERQRMARELHDTLSQGLAGLILQLEAVDAHLTEDHIDRARAIVREMMVRARSTLADARLAIDNLRSTGTLGLGEVARQETDHFFAATGIPCEVSISLVDSLPGQVTDAAIRAVSEGFTNIARHSHAKKAKLCIVAREDLNELQIEIADDGIGFDPENIEAGHYGLLGMRERVRLSGGRLEINSKKGSGTRLVIRFPLEIIADE
jgi:NarL family two-component system sensor histidine kinase YdfH